MRICKSQTLATTKRRLCFVFITKRSFCYAESATLEERRIVGINAMEWPNPDDIKQPFSILMKHVAHDEK